VDPTRFPRLLLGPTATMRDAIACIDAGAIEIALVVDGDRRLLGTITDGDVRRGLLRGIPLDAELDGVIHRTPITAPAGTGREALLRLMAEHAVEQVPLLDESGVVIDIVFLRHLLEDPSNTPVVLMAGGQGERLRPLTEQTPKPMLPVGEKPLLETVLGQVRDAGFGKVLMAVNFKAEMIREHFGNGEGLGLDISYLQEPHALGSAGALNLMREELAEPFIVMNADLLTNVNLAALLRFHREGANLMTLGVRRFELQVPYGVVEIEDEQVSSLKEKPAFGFFVNAGVYAVEPAAVALMPAELEAFSMTDLVQAALARGERVGSFPIREYWLDIGHLADYQRAHSDHATYFSAS
jgi:dTDP-glucose pyrophosphorylase